MMKNKKLLIGVVAILLLTLGAVVITSSLSSSIQSPTRQGNQITITDPETGNKMTFGKDGLVIIEDANGNVRTEVWDSEKIAAFLSYINQTYGEAASYSIGFGSDELISTILNPPPTGGEGGGGVGDYFATPTPPPGGGGGPGATGGPGGGGPGPTDAPGAPSWCKHWKLSYCADVEENDPTPFPSYPPGVIVAQNCEEWAAAGIDYNTVISNFSCVEATPAP